MAPDLIPGSPAEAPEFLRAIDWDQPWLAPFRELGLSLQCADWRRACTRQAAALDVRNHAGLPIRFVAQEQLPPGVAYEAFIGATGQVPSRENLHDFFNALMWLALPQVKIALNAIQASEITRAAQSAEQSAEQATPSAPSGGRRGRVRDAATLFDESAALVLVADPALESALRAHQWDELFQSRRASYGKQWQVIVFGHALLEKLVSPYKAITAHAWVVEIRDQAALAQADLNVTAAMVAEQLKQGLSKTRMTPLPLAGVPGWWPGQDQAFYADAQVFRPRRAR